MMYTACCQGRRLLVRGLPKAETRCTYERLYSGLRRQRTEATPYGIRSQSSKVNNPAFIPTSVHRIPILQFGFRAFGTRATGELATFGTRNESHDEHEANYNAKKRIERSMSTIGNAGNLSTVIEPTVRRKAYPNFRHASKHHHTSKRIFVEPQQRDISISKPLQKHGSYPVIAVQVARSIDLTRLQREIFCTKGVRKMRERLSVVAQLPPDASGATRFVAVFRFGSVVFFNVSPKDIFQLLNDVKSVANGLLEVERKDRFCVHVQPATDETEVTPDYCIVPELNMKSVDVISNVMAQSVALDAYNDTVDELLADFERINQKVTSEGNMSASDRDKLFRAVAQNNAIFLKLTKVGIKDRDSTSWNLSQYENVSEGMRDEFDIDRRFEHIEFKLNLIQENAKFFLDVLANQKSDSLEWIIIVLILLECVLMCIEMSGMGEPLFAFLGEFLPSREP